MNAQPVADAALIAELRQLIASARHLRLCIRFAQSFPGTTIVHTLCAKLSRSHLRQIAAIDDPMNFPRSKPAGTTLARSSRG